MRIEADWLDAAPTQSVFRLLEAAGHEALAVGGCVRNTLLGSPVSDIDIATDARPEQVIALAEAAGFRAIPTGIEHGTVSVIADGTAFEVTTFRRDVRTDGRHAVVAFSDDMTEDARRRDFTMNALYADSAGRLADPLGGLDDLRARRVRFIEDAGARIREDYLRSLRFFRFHAQYGDPEAGLDPDALDAIARNLDGLDRLSPERIGAEMRKLLMAADPYPALAAMQVTGVLARLLPGADPRLAGPLVVAEMHVGRAPSWIRRLVALGGDDPGGRLRLTRAESRRREALATMLDVGTAPGEAAYRHGDGAAWDLVLLRAAIGGTLPDETTSKAISAGADARFPVAAGDFLDRVQGPALGALLARLERAWIDSGFAMTRADLIALARQEG